jgi:hypothetical protein
MQIHHPLGMCVSVPTDKPMVTVPRWPVEGRMPYILGIRYTARPIRGRWPSLRLTRRAPLADGDRFRTLSLGSDPDRVDTPVGHHKPQH